MPDPPATDLEEILRLSADLWEGLRGARLFITGGTGFFGRWLLESFVAACDAHRLDASAVVLTRDPELFRRHAPRLAAHPALALHAGDIRTFSFPDGAFSHIIHAATPASAQLNADEPLEMWDVIVDGTRRVLELARQRGARRFLFASSGAVYGTQPPEVTHLAEDFPGAPDPLAPGAAYAAGKRAAEFLCAEMARAGGFELVIARGFAFVGPYLPLNAHFAAGNFIRDALAGGPIRVNGDGTPYRAYLYTTDLTVWLWTLLLRGAPGRAYNVGSDAAITIAELARLTARVSSPTCQVEIARPPVAGAPPVRYVPSIARIGAELGLKPTVSLEEGIRRTIAWHRSKY